MYVLGGIMSLKLSDIKINRTFSLPSHVVQHLQKKKNASGYIVLLIEKDMGYNDQELQAALASLRLIKWRCKNCGAFCKVADGSELTCWSCDALYIEKEVPPRPPEEKEV